MEKGTVNKLWKVLLIIGVCLTWISSALLTGFFEYETTLMVSSGLIAFLVGIVLVMVGLLFVNREDKPYHKAAGWLYMSLALVLFVLAAARLSVILVSVSEVGFSRLLSPSFIVQVSVVAAAFILNLVAFYMILKGIPVSSENEKKLRGSWRQLRISSVFFLVMKLLYLISEPLWQEALTRANAFAGDTVVVPGVTSMPFDVDFFVNLNTVFNVLAIVAAVWMAVSFLRVLITGMIKAAKQN